MTEPGTPDLEFAQLADDILQEGHRLRFRATGSSMTPFIRAEDVLTVEPVPISALRKGDIAFYRSPAGNAIAHRVLGRRQTADGIVLIVRGDASSGPFERVTDNQVLGRAVSLQRGDRTISLQDGFRRFAGILWATLQPVGNRLMALLRRARSVMLPGQPS